MKYILDESEYKDLVSYRDRYLDFITNKDNNIVCICHNYDGGFFRPVKDIVIQKHDLVLWLCEELGAKTVKTYLTKILRENGKSKKVRIE